MTETKTLSAKEILADISAGATDEFLMKKYGVSEKGLRSLFQKLVAAKVLTQVDLDDRKPTQGFAEPLPLMGKSIPAPVPEPHGGAGEDKPTPSSSETDAFKHLLSEVVPGNQEKVQELFNNIQAFLDHGVDVNTKTDDGYTALMLAAAWGRTDVVQLLLDRGANVDTQNALGMTALMTACAWGHKEVATLLLEKGANANLQTKEGWTAIRLAQRHGEIIELLKTHGAEDSRFWYENQKTLMLVLIFLPFIGLYGLYKTSLFSRNTNVIISTIIAVLAAVFRPLLNIWLISSIGIGFAYFLHKLLRLGELPRSAIATIYGLALIGAFALWIDAASEARGITGAPLFNIWLISSIGVGIGYLFYRLLRPGKTPKPVPAVQEASYFGKTVKVGVGIFAGLILIGMIGLWIGKDSRTVTPIHPTRSAPQTAPVAEAKKTPKPAQSNPSASTKSPTAGVSAKLDEQILAKKCKEKCDKRAELAEDPVLSYEGCIKECPESVQRAWSCWKTCSKKCTDTFKARYHQIILEQTQGRKTQPSDFKPINDESIECAKKCHEDCK